MNENFQAMMSITSSKDWKMKKEKLLRYFIVNKTTRVTKSWRFMGLDLIPFIRNQQRYMMESLCISGLSLKQIRLRRVLLITCTTVAIWKKTNFLYQSLKSTVIPSTLNLWCNKNSLPLLKSNQQKHMKITKLFRT